MGTRMGKGRARRKQEKIPGPWKSGRGRIASGSAAKAGVELSPSSPKGSPQLTQQKCSGCQWVPKAVTIFYGEGEGTLSVALCPFSSFAPAWNLVDWAEEGV